MNITDVRIYPMEEEKVRAFVTVTIDNCLVIRDIKIIQGNTDLFVAMPAKKRKDGKFYDVVHPINQETRKVLTEAILEKYEASKIDS